MEQAIIHPDGTTTASALQPLTAARVGITIRPGTLDDVAFMDSLQRTTTRQVGWMPTKQFEGKVKAGHVLVAEVVQPRRHGGTEGDPQVGVVHEAEQLDQEISIGEEARADECASVSPCLRGEPVGYLIGNDQYFKRDDVGIIYQINVLPAYRRSLVAGMLLKAQFERSAYGCKLYCCWCAQDIEANRFWESMGFVPLAFRAGSEKKSRVHIFWQKRIRSGDAATPWWFPSQTTGGAIREDRLVLPIPPGTHWSDAKPLVLPNAECPVPNEEQKALPVVKQERSAASANRKSAIANRKSTPAPAPATKNRLWFAPPAPVAPVATEAPATPKQRQPRVKRKNDPRYIAAARELRDRWLEHVNAGQFLPAPNAKYDVGRAIAGEPTATAVLSLWAIDAPATATPRPLRLTA